MDIRRFRKLILTTNTSVLLSLLYFFLSATILRAGESTSGNQHSKFDLVCTIRRTTYETNGVEDAAVMVTRTYRIDLRTLQYSESDANGDSDIQRIKRVTRGKIDLDETDTNLGGIQIGETLQIDRMEGAVTHIVSRRNTDGTILLQLVEGGTCVKRPFTAFPHPLF